MAYTVYKHTSPNGKVYIGITCKNVKARWQNGKGYHHNDHFKSAIQKYGWNNFTHEIIKDNLSYEEACQMEIKLISKYKSNDSQYGYNLTSGGEGRLGYHHTEETKEKIRQKAIGRKASKESCRKMSETRKGKKMQPFTDEHRKHISESCMGRPSNMKGKHHTEETKHKLSEINKGKWNSSKNGNAVKVYQYTKDG